MIKKIDTTLSNVQGDIDNFSFDEKTNIEAQLKNLQEVAETISLEQSVQQQEIVDLNNQVDDLNNRTDVIDDRTLSLEQKVNETDESVNDLNNQVSRLSKELSTEVNARKTADETITNNLNAIKSKSNTCFNTINDNITCLSKTTANLVNSVSDIDDKTNTMSNILNNTTERVNDVQETLTSMNTCIGDITKQTVNNTTAITSLTNTVENNICCIEQNTDSICHLENDFATVQNEIAGLQETTTNICSTINSLADTFNTQELVATNATINGDLVVNGSIKCVDFQDLTTKCDYIYLRKGATTAIPDGRLSGLSITNFDGSGCDLKIATDQEGMLKIGHAHLQTIATRDDDIPDNSLATWSVQCKTFVKPQYINTKISDECSSSHLSMKTNNSLIETADKANTSKIVLTPSSVNVKSCNNSSFSNVSTSPYNVSILVNDSGVSLSNNSLSLNTILNTKCYNNIDCCLAKYDCCIGHLPEVENLQEQITTNANNISTLTTITNKHSNDITDISSKLDETTVKREAVNTCLVNSDNIIYSNVYNTCSQIQTCHAADVYSTVYTDNDTEAGFGLGKSIQQFVRQNDSEASTSICNGCLIETVKQGNNNSYSSVKNSEGVHESFTNICSDGSKVESIFLKDYSGSHSNVQVIDPQDNVIFEKTCLDGLVRAGSICDNENTSSICYGADSIDLASTGDINITGKNICLNGCLNLPVNQVNITTTTCSNPKTKKGKAETFFNGSCFITNYCSQDNKSVSFVIPYNVSAGVTPAFKTEDNCYRTVLLDGCCPDYTYSIKQRQTDSATYKINCSNEINVFLATSAMTKNKPSSNGIITQYNWDSTCCRAQFFIPSDKGVRPAIKMFDVDNNVIQDWKELAYKDDPAHFDTAALASNGLFTNGSNRSLCGVCGNVYLRESGNNATILSSNSGAIYLRPNGDTNTCNQTTVNANGTICTLQVVANNYEGNIYGLKTIKAYNPKGCDIRNSNTVTVEGQTEIGMYLDFHCNTTTNSNFDVRLNVINDGLKLSRNTGDLGNLQVGCLTYITSLNSCCKPITITSGFSNNCLYSGNNTAIMQADTNCFRLDNTNSKLVSASDFTATYNKSFIGSYNKSLTQTVCSAAVDTDCETTNDYKLSITKTISPTASSTQSIQTYFENSDRNYDTGLLQYNSYNNNGCYGNSFLSLFSNDNNNQNIKLGINKCSVVSVYNDFESGICITNTCSMLKAKNKCILLKDNGVIITDGNNTISMIGDRICLKASDGVWANGSRIG